MSVQSNLTEGMRKIIERAGTPIRLRYFTLTIGSVWDDDVTLTVSGNDLWTSGVVLPLSSQRNSFDSILLEQGKLIEGDVKLFTHGSLLVTGSEFMVRIQLGSTTSGLEYTTLPNITTHEVSNTKIYKTIYLRQIGINGSLLGE